MYFLGIKIKFLKPEYAKKLKENPYDEYRKKKEDITTIPPATGQIREIQLANLALLKELDFVCKQNGLKYWLDFGTLLGAIRHKGFIPWDDDIDTGMMREDYEQIEFAFKKSSRNPDIFAEKTFLGKGQSLIKVKHKKCKHLFVDIFPSDYLNDILSDKERLVKSLEVKKLRKNLNSDKNLNNVEQISEKIRLLNIEIIKN